MWWKLNSTVVCILGWSLLTTAARAEVFQTVDGTPLPQPVGTAEVSLSVSRGYNRATTLYYAPDGTFLEPPITYGELFPNFVDGDAVTLDGLFKWRGEAIDPVADAALAPGSFSASCPFSVEIVLRGGSCNMAFGWYNVGDAPPAEIFELVPAQIETAIECRDQLGSPQPDGSGFCPFGWENLHPYNRRAQAWSVVRFESPALVGDPRYTGGEIAFALLPAGSPSSLCTQAKHSVLAHNAQSSGGEPWITTLIYPSAVDPDAVYIAFEDLPMTPESWRAPPPGTASQNDGDFNDFVYYVDGIACDGDPGSGGASGAAGSGAAGSGASGMGFGGAGAAGAGAGGANTAGTAPGSGGSGNGGDGESGGSANSGGTAGGASGAGGMQVWWITEDDGGCGCRASGTRAQSLPVTLLLALGWCARRRAGRRRRS